MTQDAYPRPICTIDVVLLTLGEDGLEVALLRRDVEPHAGAWSLPGGFVHADADRDCAAAARRVLQDKAGIAVSWLEQLATFSGPERDPRGWSLSVAYVALVPREMAEGTPLLWHPCARLPAMGFDHAAIVAAAVDRIRAKASYSSLPAFLLPEQFTLSQLQEAYERLLGRPLDRASFRRRILEQDVLEATDAKTTGGAHRPAQIYRMRQRDLSFLDRPFCPG